jgi:hypothetical protein
MFGIYRILVYSRSSLDRFHCYVYNILIWIDFNLLELICICSSQFCWIDGTITCILMSSNAILLSIAKRNSQINTQFGSSYWNIVAAIIWYLDYIWLFLNARMYFAEVRSMVNFRLVLRFPLWLKLSVMLKHH